jgi:hypothetical protein
VNDTITLRGGHPCQLPTDRPVTPSRAALAFSVTQWNRGRGVCEREAETLIKNSSCALPAELEAIPAASEGLLAALKFPA